MKERPILFSGPMVRALLDGRKTQTRRIMKPQPLFFTGRKYIVPDDAPKKFHDCDDIRECCPHGFPGDRLWVREAWNVFALSRDHDESWPLGEIPKADPRLDDDRRRSYCVDHPVASLPGREGGKGPWRPGIHMPRWASRITLLVTDVRVQRLHDISEEDAKAEGVERYAAGHGHVSDTEVAIDPGWTNFASYRAGFMTIWEEINGLASREANPWCWAISFRTEQAKQEAA